MADLLAVVLGLLRADAPGADHGRPAGLAAVGGAAAACAGRDRPLRRSPAGSRTRRGADAAWLLDRAATYLQVHARLAEARPLAERALAIDEAAYGPDHPDVAIRLNNLALILRDLGQLARPGRWPNGRWPSPRPPTAPTTPTSPSA